MSKTHKVTLKPEGRVVEIEEGKKLLEALRASDVYIKSSCGGHATCTDCIIKIVSGEDYISPPPFEELKILGNVFHITKERLACQTSVMGDVTIDITRHDKASDEEKLKNKTSNFSKKKLKTSVRKESDIQKIREERFAEHEKFEAEQKQKNDDWKGHWTKEKGETDSSAMPKKLGGGKRPKYFNTEKVDYENDTYTRPLSLDKQKLRDERLAREAQEKKDKKADKEFAQKSKEIPESNKEFSKFRK